MAARAKPSGSMPTKAPDVKSSADASSVETGTDTLETSSADTEAQGAQEKEETLDLDEKDLEEIEGKKIPYSRFKEVNEKAKTYEQQLKEMKSSMEAELRRAREDAEIRAAARFERAKEESSIEEEIDPSLRDIRKLREELSKVTNELSSIKGESHREKLQNHVERLEVKYPEADPVAVLAIAKHLGRTSREDIEDLMAENHEKNVTRASKQVRELLERKKAKAKAAIPTREGGIRLKESERPKTLKEATAKLKSLVGSR